MKILRTVQSLKEYTKTLNRNIGFVPTMGALHKGHTALIGQSKAHCEHTIVSIFVNPTQFLAHEDLSQYPRQEAKDLEICKRLGVDAVFLPSHKEIYTADETVIKAPNIRSYILEGAMRPGHFDGVLTVVLKLFNLVQPSHAFFGKKDAQQLLLISLMTKQLFLPIEIVGVSTVREEDGLALSSRNVYLSKEQRTQALKLSQSLRHASMLVGKHITDISYIKDAMYQTLKGIDVEYIACVDYDFQAIKHVVPKKTIILVAAKIGTTRLIDNIWL